MGDDSFLDKAGEILFPDLTPEDRNRRLNEAFDRAADPAVQERIEAEAVGAETMRDAIGDANAPKARIEEIASRRDGEIAKAFQSTIEGDPDFAAKLETIRADVAERYPTQGFERDLAGENSVVLDFEGIETDPDEYERQIAADELDVRIDGI